MTGSSSTHWSQIDLLRFRLALAGEVAGATVPSARAFRYTPLEVKRSPIAITTAPELSMVRSPSAPNAAGRKHSPAKTIKAPAAISQLPVLVVMLVRPEVGIGVQIFFARILSLDPVTRKSR